MVNRSKILHFAARAAVTLLVFWLVLRGVDAAHWLAILQGQNLAWLMAVAALVMGQITLGAWRWRMILAAIAPDGQAKMTLSQTFNIYYIGVFFNACLPGSIGGDAVRVWLAKSEHIPLTLAVHSVIIDRLIGLMALGGLIAGVLIPMGKMAGFDALPFLLGVVAAGVVGLWLLLHIENIMGKWKHRRFIAWLLYLAGNLRLLLRQPASALAIVAFALAGHIAYCVCAYLIAHSLGIGIDLMQCIILIPPVPLITALPVSIGGWGVREAGMVAMLSLAGVPQAAVLMVSVQLGLANIVMSLPGGVLWLRHRRT